MPILIKFTVALLAMWSLLARAGDSYENNPLALALIDEMVQEEGFDRDELLTLFANAEKQQSILDAIARPAEKTKPWHEYRKIFVTDKRAARGREFYAEHRETLERAEAETGVPAEIIVAIIGVETLYGRITGSYRVLDALSTLAFDYPRRSAFFTSALSPL